MTGLITFIYFFTKITDNQQKCNRIVYCCILSYFTHKFNLISKKIRKYFQTGDLISEFCVLIYGIIHVVVDLVICNEPAGAAFAFDDIDSAVVRNMSVPVI